LSYCYFLIKILSYLFRGFIYFNRERISLSTCLTFAFLHPDCLILSAFVYLILGPNLCSILSPCWPSKSSSQIPRPQAALQSFSSIFLPFSQILHPLLWPTICLLEASTARMSNARNTSQMPLASPRVSPTFRWPTPHGLSLSQSPFLSLSLSPSAVSFARCMAHYAVHLSGHYSKFDLDLAALLKLEHLARLHPH